MSILSNSITRNSESGGRLSPYGSTMITNGTTGKTRDKGLLPLSLKMPKNILEMCTGNDLFLYLVPPFFFKTEFLGV